MRDTSNEPGMCELCCKLINSDDDVVGVDLIGERLPSTGTSKAHRHCASLSVSLGSLAEARQLLAPRTSRQLLAIPDSLPRREAKTITIRPARVVINTMHTGALFTPNQRTQQRPA
jgi:hypothetical protein